jgi:hypothetical protein
MKKMRNKRGQIMKIDPIKLMLLGIMLMLLGGAFEARGLEWVVFAAGVVTGVSGFFHTVKKNE